MMPKSRSLNRSENDGSTEAFRFLTSISPFIPAAQRYGVSAKLHRSRSAEYPDNCPCAEWADSASAARTTVPMRIGRGTRMVNATIAAVGARNNRPLVPAIWFLGPWGRRDVYSELAASR